MEVGHLQPPMRYREGEVRGRVLPRSDTSSLRCGTGRAKSLQRFFCEGLGDRPQPFLSWTPQSCERRNGTTATEGSGKRKGALRVRPAGQEGCQNHMSRLGVSHRWRTYRSCGLRPRVKRREERLGNGLGGEKWRATSSKLRGPELRSKREMGVRTE